ncbi:unnamed protein product [Porites lobata]|uniref:Uncharacterized protein n=1 Tax=Porites lobata TaxID=104759 RepID=A0ABN8R2P9_9CNID|nr:unnamed protein product [Porites lobata]
MIWANKMLNIVLSVLTINNAKAGGIAVDIKEKRMMYFDPMFTSDQDRLESNDIKSSLMSSLMHRHM